MAGSPERLQIREDDLAGPEIAGLLREHLEEMHAITPPGSVHAMDLEALRESGATVWTLWDADELVACCGLKELDRTSGEIKSMRTARRHRGRGYAASLLEHLIAEARRRSYARLYLETGASPAFAAARALYERRGFVYRGPFGRYRPDPNSVFMELPVI